MNRGYNTADSSNALGEILFTVLVIGDVLVPEEITETVEHPWVLRQMRALKEMLQGQ